MSDEPAPDRVYDDGITRVWGADGCRWSWSCHLCPASGGNRKTAEQAALAAHGHLRTEHWTDDGTGDPWKP